MKTGIELIAQERKEQIEKHGHDAQDWQSGQLIVAAQASILGNPKAFPKWWQENSPFVDKICAKPLKERLVIAGALLAAEIDRINVEQEIASNLDRE